MSRQPTISEETYAAVGRLCHAWAELENTTESIIWGVLGVNETIGKLLTWPKDVRQRWQMLVEVAPLKHTNDEVAVLRSINNHLVNVCRDRNIIVHGFVNRILQIKVKKGTFEPASANMVYTWTIYKGAPAGRLYPVTYDAVEIVIKNIHTLNNRANAFRQTHGYKKVPAPKMPIERAWPKLIE